MSLSHSSRKGELSRKFFADLRGANQTLFPVLPYLFLASANFWVICLCWGPCLEFKAVLSPNILTNILLTLPKDLLFIQEFLKSSCVVSFDFFNVLKEWDSMKVWNGTRIYKKSIFWKKNLRTPSFWVRLNFRILQLKISFLHIDYHM